MPWKIAGPLQHLLIGAQHGPSDPPSISRHVGRS